MRRPWKVWTGRGAALAVSGDPHGGRAPRSISDSILRSGGVIMIGQTE